MIDVEKRTDQHVENISNAQLIHQSVTARERKLVRKIDTRIMPFLTLLYFFSFLDRGNIGNAKLLGLMDILDNDPQKFSICLALFYVGYASLMLPMNLLSKKFKPNHWVAACCIGWGAFSSAQAGVNSFSGLAALRFMMGASEAGFGAFPPLYYSYWYTREEQGKRNTLQLGAIALTGAFTGLIGYGVGSIKNPAINPWRILYLIEGLPTILLGVCTLLLLPTRPEEAKFLSEEEKELAIERVNRGSSSDEDPHKLDFAHVRRGIFSWKTALYALMLIGGNVALSSTSGYLPTIVSELGYSTTRAQLMTVPPYATAYLCMAITTILSDYYGTRGIFVVGSFLVGAIGYIIALTVKTNLAVRYFSNFVLVSGMYCGIPLSITWCANNSGSESKRATMLGCQIMSANAMSILGSFIYPASDKPYYVKGFSISLGFALSSSLSGIVMSIYTRYENRRRNKLYGKPSPLDRVDLSEDADKAPGFRYLQ